MDPPADDIELQPEKLVEEKESGPLFHCDFYDTDIVYKIGQTLLHGLASACIDNSIGGIFKSPASVAVDIRREMVNYLIQRSENFMAESVVLEGVSEVEVPVDPYDIISDFIDDFVSSKRNFFSRVSGWLLSEKREDWIDDLVQEMEINGFWLLNRRISVAQILLKNLDFRNLYHCNMNFKTPEDLEKHKSHCNFRAMSCDNEGCNSRFSAAKMDDHDSICPFKILPCEQKCPDSIMRREMDRHCITICPMKLVKCPFYSVGCQSTIPQSTIEQHRSESLPCHLLYILQVFHKEASPEDLKERVKELEKLSSPGRLASARDARSLTAVVKGLEAKLGPLQVKANAKPSEEEVIDKKEENKGMSIKDEKVAELIDKKEESSDTPTKHVRFNEPPSEKEETVSSHSKDSDHEDSCHERGELMESSINTSAQSQTNEEEVVAPIIVQENLKESSFESEEDLGSLTRMNTQMENSSKEVVDPFKEEHSPTTVEQEELTESVDESEKHAEPSTMNELSTQSPPEEVSTSVNSHIKNGVSVKSPPKEEHSESSDEEVSKESPPAKEQTDSSSSSASEVGKESPPAKEQIDASNSASLRVNFES